MNPPKVLHLSYKVSVTHSEDYEPPGRFARAMAKNAGERFGNVLFYGLILLLVYLVYRIFEAFLVPLGWAAVFAVIFHSLNQELERKWGRNFAALVSTIGVTLILVVPSLLLMILFVREGIDATRGMEISMTAGEYGGFNRVWAWITAHIPAHITAQTAIDLPGLVRQGAGRLGGYLASQFGAVLRNIVLFLFELVVMLFALFYFLRDAKAIMKRIRLFLPFEETMREKMLAEARDLIFASVTTSLVIAAVQGIVCGGAFAIVGVNSSLFWGVVMAFLALLPVVGAWPIWVPAAIWLFSTGHIMRGLILIGICGGVGSTIDNILRPLLLGGRSSLNGLLVFISVLGGLAVFGVLGVVLGPIVVATAVGVLDVYSQKEMTAEAAAAAEES